MKPVLVSLTYSPWSEKARWALEHHRITYQRRSYRPLIDELPLRMRMRRFRGPITVPVLYDGARWHSSSWEIARWAEQHGSGAPLFPDEHLERIRYFDDLSERGLDAGRALGLTRMVDRPEWLVAMVPPALRGPLGPLGPKIAGVGIRRTLRKYGASTRSTEEHRDRLRQVLEELRASLQHDGDGVPTLLGRFSYADISMAQVLQFVEPTNLGHFRLADEGREGYRQAELAEAFADLCGWREQLYAAHHP